MASEIKFAEGFAGIGGFRLGLEQASSRYKCVWANDFESRAQVVYTDHYGLEEFICGDFKRIDKRTIPDHDLFCAGFPCQSFSIAGRRQGFQDIRGTLFFDICEVLQTKRPNYVWLENVRGLLNHEGGQTFYTILMYLDELGYDCQWQMLNSKYFGVPQHRERVFIIGNIRGAPFQKILPIEQLCETYPNIPTLTTRYFGSQANGAYIRDPQGIRRLTPRECELAQGFPGNWTSSSYKLEDRYILVGNSVTVPIIKEIAKRVANAIP